MTTIRILTYSDTNHRHLKDALEETHTPYRELGIDTIELDAADAPPELDEIIDSYGAARFDLG